MLNAANSFCYETHWDKKSLPTSAPGLCSKCATRGGALSFHSVWIWGRRMITACQSESFLQIRLDFTLICQWGFKVQSAGSILELPRVSWHRGVSAYAVFAWQGFSTVFLQLPTSEFKISVKCSVFFHDVPVLTSCDFPIQWCTIRQPTDL